MKVRELIQQLRRFDGAREIYLSNDEEGHAYKPISHVDDFTDDGSGLVIFPYG